MSIIQNFGTWYTLLRDQQYLTFINAFINALCRRAQGPLLVQRPLTQIHQHAVGLPFPRTSTTLTSAETAGRRSTARYRKLFKRGWLSPFLAVSLFMILLVPSHLMAWYFNYRPNTVNQVQAGVVKSASLVTVMLVPAGDARSQGRSLEHQFESSSAMAYVLSLKDAIEKTYPEVRVIVSHRTGEIVQQFQVPTMANTLGIDLVMTVNCYHEQGPKPELYIYQFSYGADFVSRLTELSWYTIDSAYLFSKTTTHAWGMLLADELRADTYKPLFTVQSLYKMPFKPLIGIKVPAIGLEMGIVQDADWAVFVDPIVVSLEQVVRPLIKQRTVVEVL